jgi:hypothetical protein
MDIFLILISFLLIFLSQLYIKNAYKKYDSINIKSNKNGYDVAKLILSKHKLDDIEIGRISGELTDHYDPRNKVISLSDNIYSNSSIASVSVAAHECCHVIQHKEKYFFMIIRNILVPVINITSKLGYILLLVGILASVLNVAKIGIILMCGALLFQLITLPTEFNASSRAIKELKSLKRISNDEVSSAKSMLRAAAMTYLASFFANMLQILRLFLNVNRRN